MKYLSDYIQDAQSSLFKETGTIFAFSKKQFDEQRQEGVVYTNCGSGMLCPKNNVENLINGLKKIFDEGVKQDLAENGKEKIIRRELFNHEAFYTCDIQPTIDALSVYEGISDEDIVKVYYKIKKEETFEF
jgi:hypothetical protein